MEPIELFVFGAVVGSVLGTAHRKVVPFAAKSYVKIARWTGAVFGPIRDEWSDSRAKAIEAERQAAGKARGASPAKAARDVKRGQKILKTAGKAAGPG